jgi:hypothetical protein
MSNRQTHLDAIAIVARGLDELADDVAFVGGAAVTLYIDDAGGEDVRSTKDVDCVIEVAGHSGLANLEARLRCLGFLNDTTPGTPICRWQFAGLTVDIMPTDSSILGFSNRWYPDAMKQRRSVRVTPDVEVFIFTLPYFIASKLEAFGTRGRRDCLASHDLEDVITVLDRATAVQAEIAAATGELRAYIDQELGQLVGRSDVEEILAAHLMPGPTSGARVQRLHDMLVRLTA